MITQQTEVFEKQPRILIADDIQANVALLERILKISGYENIRSTTDARELFDLYHDFKPDLLLLDLKMPYLSGFEIIEKLNGIKADDFLSIVVITAQSDKQNRLKALELGATDFIGKPFDVEEVLFRIKNILEVRLLHNEVREQKEMLEEKVRERTMELLQLQYELIERLLKAAEFRDNNTGSHINRIGSYAFELGRIAGLPLETCTMLKHASMMHDIGKIGIPDEVLLKAGKLDQEEWDKMRTHTVKGAQILQGSTYEMIRMAERIALSHHEKWDGSGYPQGLMGEEIPLEGRITSICDVFDALLTDRPYRKAWEVGDVISEIEKGRGSHFDPVLTDHFIDNIQRFIEINQRFS